MCPSSQATPRKRNARSSLGFTLLEVIVIVIVGGLLAALVVNLMGTQLLRSTSPSTIAGDAGDAEALMEAVVARFTNEINANATSAALDNMKTYYPNNSTIHIDDATWNSVRTLTVTTTVGNTSYTTLLTQERTNALDNATNF